MGRDTHEARQSINERTRRRKTALDLRQRLLPNAEGARQLSLRQIAIATDSPEIVPNVFEHDTLPRAQGGRHALLGLRSVHTSGAVVEPDAG